MQLPPMSLRIAMLVMTMAAAGLGMIVACGLRRRSSSALTAWAAVAALLLVVHAFWLNGNVTLARWVGSPDAIVWANLSPFFVAILIAAAWRAMTVTWQRWVMLLALPAFCVAQAYGPIFGDVPPVGPSRVVNGVHHQSTLSTCSAAAAATLLGHEGIQSTEAEMAQLCLTRSGGTLQLGLYRGLRLKAPRATVEFLNDDLSAVIHSPRPVIVSLGLRPSLWNLLQPRGGHSVVILGRTEDGRLQIADPMTGGSYPMPVGEFERLWSGEALRLVP